MPETNLAVTFDDLAAASGDELRWGRKAYADYTADQKIKIEAYIQDMWRRFLRAHKWSWLQLIQSLTIHGDLAEETGEEIDGGVFAAGKTPLTISAGDRVFHEWMVGKVITISAIGTTEFTITDYTSSTEVSVSGDASTASGDLWALVVGDGDYPLDKTCAGIIGKITFETGSGYPALNRIGEGRIRSLRQISSTGGIPDRFATRIMEANSAGARYELMLYPTPSGSYVLSYLANILHVKLADGTDIPFGAVNHGETLIAGCLAMVEHREFGEKGTRWVEWRELLKESIAEDQDITAPDFLSVSGGGDGRLPSAEYNVTINGQDVSALS